MRRFMSASMLFAFTLCQAQTSFDIGSAMTSWGCANLGVNTLARQRAVIRGQDPDAPRKANSARFAVAPRPASGPVTTTYRRDPQTASAVNEEFLAQMQRHANGADVAPFRQALAQESAEARFARVGAKEGFQSFDAADAMAAYFMINWMMANNGHETRTQAAGLRNQFRLVLLSTTSFQSLDELSKQVLAETYILHFLVLQTAYVNALQKHDEAARQNLAAAAEGRFQKDFKLDLRSMVLTPSGFSGI